MLLSMKDDKDDYVFQIRGNNKFLVEELNDTLARMQVISEQYSKIQNGEVA